MYGRPWLFDNSLLILKQLDGLLQPEAHVFDTESFWLRFYKLPVMYMNKHFGTEIGKTLGEVEEVEVDTDDTSWGHYLGLRVKLNLFKVVAKGRSLEVRGEKI